MTAAKYVIVWLGVMGLALASFLLSLLHLGAAAPYVALGIALVKAVLIALFFMHLVEQPSVSRWAFLLGLCLAALLLVMVGLDVLTRDQTGLRQPGLDIRSDLSAQPPSVIAVSSHPPRTR